MSSWATAKLKDVAKIVTGKTPKTSNPDYYGNDIPFISPADLNEAVFADAKIYLTHLGADQVYKVPKNTVLVSCIGNLGKLTIVDREVCFNQQINGLIFDEQKIFPKYGFYYAQTLKPQLEKASSSTTLPIVNKSKFSELEIQYPPLEEQRRIAEILDKADSLIQKRKESITKLDELLQATFIEMFGDPISNPKGFSLTQLDSLVTKPITYGVLKPEEYTENGIPMLRIQDINSKNNLSTLKDFHLISLELSNQYKRTILNGSEIVISLVGSIGLVAKVPNEFKGFNVHRNLGVIDLKDKSSVNYVLYFMKMPSFMIILDRICKGGVHRLLNLTDLRDLEIPIPPKELQDKWAEFATVVEKQKQTMQTQLEMQETLFKSLQQQAFSGQL